MEAGLESSVLVPNEATYWGWLECELRKLLAWDTPETSPLRQREEVPAWFLGKTWRPESSPYWSVSRLGGLFVRLTVFACVRWGWCWRGQCSWGLLASWYWHDNGHHSSAYYMPGIYNILISILWVTKGGMSQEPELREIKETPQEHGARRGWDGDPNTVGWSQNLGMLLLPTVPSAFWSADLMVL